MSLLNIDHLLKTLKRLSLQLKPYGFSGNYPDWNTAKNKCKGYDDKGILDKVLLATQEVMKGNAAFERDSVLFYEAEYDWFVLSVLMHAYNTDRKLHVVDFGGALGSIYFQHKMFLDPISPLTWHVIEQPSYVETGRKYLQHDALYFNNNLKEAFEQQPINLVMFRCVLPYLEHPYKFLQEAIDLNPNYLLIDRNPFVEGNDRICVQKVTPKIVDSSYPAWFFNKQKMLDFMADRYELIASTSDRDIANIACTYDGLLFKKRS